MDKKPKKMSCFRSKHQEMDKKDAEKAKDVKVLTEKEVEEEVELINPDPESMDSRG